MSLVARKVEARGIATVVVSVMPSATAALPAPRNVVVRFRLGQVFGEPQRRLQHVTIMRHALELVETATQTGTVVELPYRWKRNSYG
ncbi:MAG: hypothetical protein ACE5HT_01070 [Gemmatimonadales bacterium]